MSTGSSSDSLKDVYEIGEGGKDGVLILEAPVKVPEYQSLTLNESGQIGIRPKSNVQLQTVPSSKALTVKGIQGSTILDDGSGGKRLHIEVPVDSTYKPEDLCVTVDSNRVVVKGRHQKEESDARGKSGSVTEFTQSYTVSEMVDPLSVSAQLIGNTLVLEAPLVKHIVITH
ncbi:unnamed protein product [Trichobilharzia regenti]|nr:unnamed protein product [Trichobilharzia regenti]